MTCCGCLNNSLHRVTLGHVSPFKIITSFIVVSILGIAVTPYIKHMHSVSNYGIGTIQITFAPNTDISLKKFEVTSIVRQLYPHLNGQIGYPTVEQRTLTSSQEKPLLSYRITACKIRCN